MADSNMLMVAGILSVVLGIAVSIGLFFLFRAITCWYLKINKMLAELKKIDAHMERIAFLTEKSMNAQFAALNQSSQAFSSPSGAATQSSVPYSGAPSPSVSYSEPVAATTSVSQAEQAAPVSQAVRYCINCGNQLQDGQDYCVVCGTKN